MSNNKLDATFHPKTARDHINAQGSAHASIELGDDRGLNRAQVVITNRAAELGMVWPDPEKIEVSRRLLWCLSAICFLSIGGIIATIAVGVLT